MSNFAKDIILKRNDGTFYFDLTRLQVLGFHNSDPEFNETDFVCHTRRIIKLGKLQFFTTYNPQYPFQCDGICLNNSKLVLFNEVDSEFICQLLFTKDIGKFKTDERFAAAQQLVQILTEMALGHEVKPELFQNVWSTYIECK